MTDYLSFPYVMVLPLLGVAVATLGTLVGLGGGFILVPILLIIFPDTPPHTIAGISLTVVFLNALSATIGNVRAHRIDVRTAGILAIGALPAAVAGSLVSGRVSREFFQVVFGVLLIMGAAYVLWRSTRLPPGTVERQPNRRIQERKGTTYSFYVSGLLAGVIGPAAGFISSFFGIGGGIINVPAMTFILKMPPRVVNATSLFILTFTSSAAVSTHLIAGQFDEGWRRAGLLGIGALVGAQLGTILAGRVNPRLTLMVLSIGLVLVGVRQIVVNI